MHALSLSRLGDRNSTVEFDNPCTAEVAPGADPVKLQTGMYALCMCSLAWGRLRGVEERVGVGEPEWEWVWWWVGMVGMRIGMGM